MVVTNEQYAAWMEHHMRAFGIVGTPFADNFMGSMICWQGEFTDKQYTYTELMKATQETIGSENVPQYANGHIATINKSVANQRERARNKARSESAASHVYRKCDVCGGNGIVVVPAIERDAESGRPKGIQRKWEPDHLNEHGEEVYYEVGVICDASDDCLRQRGDGMRLSRYKRYFPNWESEKIRINNARKKNLDNQEMPDIKLIINVEVARITEGAARRSQDAPV